MAKWQTQMALRDHVSGFDPQRDARISVQHPGWDSVPCVDLPQRGLNTVEAGLINSLLILSPGLQRRAVSSSFGPSSQKRSLPAFPSLSYTQNQVTQLRSYREQYMCRREGRGSAPDMHISFICLGSFPQTVNLLSLIFLPRHPSSFMPGSYKIWFSYGAGRVPAPSLSLVQFPSSLTQGQMGINFCKLFVQFEARLKREIIIMSPLGEIVFLPVKHQ